MLHRLIGSAFLTLGITHVAEAATFTVTEQKCYGGAGTLSQAVRDANTNPGHDVIEISPGLILESYCDNDGTKEQELVILESVTIKGQGGAIHGVNAYIDINGDLSELDTGGFCPVRFPFTLIGSSRGLFQVGQRNVDNSGIELIVEDLTIYNLSQVARVRDGAKLTLRRVDAIDIRDLQFCSSPVIAADDDADVTLENVRIGQSTDFARTVPNAIVYGEDGKLEIYNSWFSLNPTRFAVAWGGDADIVSSRFFNSGGLWLTGAGTMQVINSLFLPETISAHRRYQDGFLVSLGGTMRFKASTVVYHVNDCRPFLGDTPGTSGDCNWNGGEPSDAAFQARSSSGRIELIQSAINVQTIAAYLNPNRTLLMEDFGQGNITADALTFVQPVDWQDAAALRAITNQPALITGPDALPVTDTLLGYLAFSYPGSVTPIITGAAVLVDRVADAGPGGANELRDGRGAVITKDVLGNPRVDANGTRNIGAVQLTLAPHLAVTGTSDMTVDLSWSRPQDPGTGAITGYEVCFGTGKVPDPSVLVTDCKDGDGNPGTLQSISGAPETVTGQVSGLTNGEAYWLLVRAVNPDPGPWSIAVKATPYGEIGTPVVSVESSCGATTVNWTQPDLGGHQFGDYLVTWSIKGSGVVAGSSVIADYDTLSTTIYGLDCSTAYVFSVVVNTSTGGYGSAGTAVYIPALPIPTLDSIGLLLLAMLVIGIGVLRIRRMV